MLFEMFFNNLFEYSFTFLWFLTLSSHLSDIKNKLLKNISNETKTQIEIPTKCYCFKLSVNLCVNSRKRMNNRNIYLEIKIFFKSDYLTTKMSFVWILWMQHFWWSRIDCHTKSLSIGSYRSLSPDMRLTEIKIFNIKMYFI